MSARDARQAVIPAGPGRTGQVVVIGAGLAGLLAAAAASGAGRSVMLLDRDPLTSGPLPRDGVPQGRQVHVLLYRGLLALEELLPGLRRELLEAGGVPLDTGRLAFLNEAGWSPIGLPGFEMVSATRPLVEHLVRQRVQALAGVDVRGGRHVRGLSRRAGGGWLVELAEGPPLAADVVVDASGRGSRLPAWLAQAGFGEVSTTVVDAGIGYASRLYAAPVDILGDVAGVLLFPTPDHPYGGLAFPVEGGRWVVNTVGFRPDRPPRDAEGFEAFLSRIRDPALSDFVRTARPVGDVAVHRQTSNVRNHYDRMKRWPPGLLVIGDALCAFNPIYGQGITVCAQEALLLREALEAGLRPGTERRLLRRFQRVTSLPWESATGEDLRYPSSEAGLSPVQGVFSRWARALEALAAHGDQRAQRTLDRLYHLMGSEAELFHPALIVAALRARLFGHRDAVPRPSLTPDVAAPSSAGHASTP